MIDFAQAFDTTVSSLILLGSQLDDDEWRLPTECPGWTVKDNVSHIVGIQKWLQGEPEPAHELPDDLPHVRNDLGRRNELDVDLRRPYPPSEVLDELRAVLATYRAGLTTTDRAGDVETPFGPRPFAKLMMSRTYDVWTHEQDIRRATNRPGNLSGPGAECTKLVLVQELPVVAERAGVEPGRSVTFVVTGPVAFTRTITTGPDGRGSTLDAADPAVTITLDWESFVRLGCGRCTPDAVELTVEGDRELAAKVLAQLTMTP